MSTIAAVATAMGPGAIGIVRVSGPLAREVLTKVVAFRAVDETSLRPWVLHRGRLLDWDGSFVDDVLAVYMPSPKTYTGEDMAEIHCHGSPLILTFVLERLFALGCVMAGRGEFTKRAFLQGRIDLSQAEAVAELVSAKSKAALSQSVQRLDGALKQIVEDLRRQVDELRCNLAVAVDFPEEELDCLSHEDFLRQLDSFEAILKSLLQGTERGRLLQEGARVVLVGPVNSGKSSLLNALIGRARALVSDLPGTTRDFLEEYCTLDGLPVKLTDTAGLRGESCENLDPVEKLGIERGLECTALADCLILVLDGQVYKEADLAREDWPKPPYEAWLKERNCPIIIVWNKVDCVEPKIFPPRWAKDCPAVTVSALTGAGVDRLARIIRQTLLGLDWPSASGLTCNARQAAVLNKACAELDGLRQDVQIGIPYDACAVRLDYLASILGEIIGLSTAEEVLNAIFDRFCLGK